jgi:transposase
LHTTEKNTYDDKKKKAKENKHEKRWKMKAYSQDLRERVLKAVDQGMQRKEAVKLFGISESSIKRYLKLRYETGNLAPKAMVGRPPKKVGALQNGLLPQLQAHPDATLKEHCKLWEQETGMRVSISTMSESIKRLEWTRKKKTLEAKERKEEERQKWREKAKELDVHKLRVVDETGSNLTLTRRYARAPKGKRACGSLPCKRGKNVTMITDLSLNGLGETVLLDGAANGSFFEAYVEHILAPTLKPGEIVILDNLSIHKGKRVRDLIEARGCQLLFLPTYSPDLSPIEEAFSKVKALLRSRAAQTREALYQALTDALTAVTPSDAAGWFRHCGYCVPDSSKTEAA